MPKTKKENIWDKFGLEALPFNPKNSIWKKLNIKERERLCDALTFCRMSAAMVMGVGGRMNKKAVVGNLRKASVILEEFSCEPL
jgi:hypothetical protein